MTIFEINELRVKHGKKPLPASPTAEFFARVARRHRERCLYCLDGECPVYADYIRLSMLVLEPFRPPLRAGKN